MRWFLITDDAKLQAELETFLAKSDKANKLITCSFEAQSISKQKKFFEEAAGIIIYSSKDISELNILNQLTGYFIANGVSIITNIEELVEDTIFSKENLFYCGTSQEISSFMEKYYSSISNASKERLAKNKLLERGIPFTSDCFATYIAKNKVEIFNEFLEAGMSVNSRDDMGVPMLNIACRNDNFEFVEMLLDLGAELNASSDDRGYTAVMDAVWRGNEKITKLLIEKGADLNTISKEGQSNLVLAVGADRLNICKMLVENGSDPDIKDMMGMSAYQYATLFRKEKIAEVLKPYHKEG